MFKRLMTGLKLLVTFALIIQFVGCGTILYPERKGQKSGRIDPGVAVLDAIGLVFFLVPGVIAFAVDFATGTIYLPGTAKASLDMEDLRQVKFEPENGALKDIEIIIEKETGLDVNLSEDNVQVFELKSTDDMVMHFEKVSPALKNSPNALAMK